MPQAQPAVFPSADEHAPIALDVPPHVSVDAWPIAARPLDLSELTRIFRLEGAAWLEARTESP